MTTLGTLTNHSTPTDAPTWTIRVGGIYKSNTRPDRHTKRVARIDGDTVYFENWEAGEKEPWSQGEMSAAAFRQRVLPEDQSPIPEILAALRIALAFAEDELACRERSYLPEPTKDEQGDLDQASHVVDVILSAIAKAESR